MFKEILKYFEEGYEIYLSSWYGDDILESEEEINEIKEEMKENNWLTADIEVKDDEKKVYIFVGNDE